MQDKRVSSELGDEREGAVGAGDEEVGVDLLEGLEAGTGPRRALWARCEE